MPYQIDQILSTADQTWRGVRFNVGGDYLNLKLGYRMKKIIIIKIKKIPWKSAWKTDYSHILRPGPLFIQRPYWKNSCNWISKAWTSPLPHVTVDWWIWRAKNWRQYWQDDISAEIPDPQTHPEFHKIITSNMIHGQCGDINKSSSCMDDNKCTKSFPKPFSAFTAINSNGYPTYWRRDTGISYPLNSKSNSSHVDNRW